MEGLRTWCEIDGNAILYNLAQIRKQIGPRRIIAAVIKADAYGHGAKEIARLLENTPRLIFAVATPDEAISLRQQISDKPILILSCLRVNEIESVIQSNCIPSIVHDDVAKRLDNLARKTKKKINVHIEVDTGIGRIGPYYTEAAEFIWKVASLPNIQIEGIFTHFASADEKSHFTDLQIQRFEMVIKELKKNGIRAPISHAANSAGIITHPKSYYDMVRPGLMLYGLYPSQEMKSLINLKQAMTLKSEIVHLRKVKPGFSVSYGRTYITTRPTTIATVNVGYRNGYNRLCSNQGKALVKGKRVPIIGRICMDQLMLDVTNVANVKLGDTVVFLGKQGNDFIAMDEIANWSSTINYETSCTLGTMTKRIYI